MPIQVLPKNVVDKIAAGEVVQRAASAIKEMIENSLDAKATEIQVIVHSVSSFHMVDNGVGIPKSDFDLACTRHATSKLREASDLSSIASFGFRGEALASISMVADVEIHSRTKDSPVGFSQRYQSGKPLSETPTPSARKVGTTIRVTNLFANLPTRQKLRLSNEYAAIFKVIQSYAVHYPQVSFICNKVDKPADLITRPSNPASATVTASSLFGLDKKQWLEHSKELKEDDTLIYKSFLCISESVSNGRNKVRLPFLLFVNDRLVANSTIQKAIEGVVTENSSHKHSLMYLSVHVPPDQVDVNVHPTKQSVVLFHLDKIANDLAESLRLRLADSSTIETMETSSKPSKRSKVVDDESSTTTKRPKPSSDPKIRLNTMVGALDSYIVDKKTSHHEFCPVDLSQPGAFASKDCRCADIRGAPSLPSVAPVTPSLCNYASIRKLRANITKRCNAETMNQLRKAAWVGQLSKHRSLLQVGPNLMMWSHTTAATHMFRQLALWKFGDCPMATLEPGIDICSVISHLHQIEEDLDSSSTSPSEANVRIAQQATDFLIQKKDMLLEYFSIRISDDGTLNGLPILLDKHVASPSTLPLFLLRLATCVDYDNEKTCFDGICRELGLFYGVTGPKEIFPTLRSLLQPPHEIELQPLTSLKECYKVFERC